MNTLNRFKPAPKKTIKSRMDLRKVPSHRNPTGICNTSGGTIVSTE